MTWRPIGVDASHSQIIPSSETAVKGAMITLLEGRHDCTSGGSRNLPRNGWDFSFSVLPLRRNATNEGGTLKGDSFWVRGAAWLWPAISAG
jgi:hypothetical protein